MIIINLILIFIALIFYFLSFYTPKQEYFLYGIAAVLFLIAGISGLAGYSDVIIGQSETLIHGPGNSTITTIVYEYSGSDLFKRYLPFTEILISLYLFLTLAVIRTNKDDKY